MPKSVEERFWQKVERNGPDECWLWTGAIASGYGVIWVDGRNAGAHRVSFEIANGPIQDGLVIDHLCRTPACVNPTHLEMVAVRENTLRGVGPSASNASKTHCPQGHPYDGTNLVGTDRHRLCRVCERSRNRRYDMANRTKRTAQQRARRLKGRSEWADKLLGREMNMGVDYVLKIEEVR